MTSIGSQMTVNDLLDLDDMSRVSLVVTTMAIEYR